MEDVDPLKCVQQPRVKGVSRAPRRSGQSLHRSSKLWLHTKRPRSTSRLAAECRCGPESFGGKRRAHGLELLQLAGAWEALAGEDPIEGGKERRVRAVVL